MNRRTLLLGGAAALAGAQSIGSLLQSPAHAAERFEIMRTDEEWRRVLAPDQYNVLRKHGTERAGSSPLDRENRTGTFACAGCDLPVYRSADKFESGTGWPSFTRPIEGAVGTSEDRGWFGTRTEVHCRRCGGHLGHVFDDGPKPTGLRYCMNGIAMKFEPATAS
jgi:peptide-methionine (R)-S-oxide reductase